MKKIAYIFPGQGAQSVGMGKDVYENYESAKNIYESADRILEKNITNLCFDGPEEALKQTINTQPAIVTTSIALLSAFNELTEGKIAPAATAGHSLGEYCAMYAAGVMDLDSTLRLIQKRAELMSKTTGGTMAAVLNASDEQLEAGLKEGAKQGYVAIANYNSPYQTVITGDEDAVKTTSDYLLANGVRRVVPLAVSGAFHSKYMENAAEVFGEYLKEFSLSDAKCPVFTNVDANESVSAEEFREKMPRQIYSSVYWYQAIEKMISNGIDTFIEIGPNKILAGLNKKINSDITTYNIYDLPSLELTVKSIME